VSSVKHKCKSELVKIRTFHWVLQLWGKCSISIDRGDLIQLFFCFILFVGLGCTIPEYLVSIFGIAGKWRLKDLFFQDNEERTIAHPPPLLPFQNSLVALEFPSASSDSHPLRHETPLFTNSWWTVLLWVKVSARKVAWERRRISGCRLSRRQHRVLRRYFSAETSDSRK